MKPRPMVGDAHPTQCRLIIDPPAPGVWNMAVDEALLIDAAESGIATLRFYQWNEPTLSLGYFQAYEDRYRHAASRMCACVRRQTGGGAILHDREITYSIALPASHPWARQTEMLYAAVHDAFIRVLSALVVVGSAAPVLRRIDKLSTFPATDQPFLCFERRAVGDVVIANNPPAKRSTDPTAAAVDHWKIIGSAQRRSRGTLLQHGSVLLHKSEAAPELPGFVDITGSDVSSDTLRLIVSQLEGVLETRFSPSELPHEVELNAGEIANSKYGTAAWTKRR